MSHIAAERVSWLRGERDVFGEVVVPARLEGQVCLHGPGDGLTVPEQLNFDFWWVEVCHVTD